MPLWHCAPQLGERPPFIEEAHATVPRLEPLISFKVPFGNSLRCLGDQFTVVQVATTFAGQ